MDYASLITALAGGAGVSLVVLLTRYLLPKIPRAFVPPLGMALGVMGEWLIVQLGGEPSPLRAAAMGAFATWLREAGNTINQHGILKPSDKP